ncbi:hypothetical protein HPP92_000571 [Vanilla planifolia]|uniref:Uncharacterized protein n=1 Tax=Vanilla planifolia TaxID=51239 RepID=A0A835VH61_VANPL|nr:hypothetical protein HPP92_000571 [Vanilla planifolia]
MSASPAQTWGRVWLDARRDDAASFRLKMLFIGAILISGVLVRSLWWGKRRFFDGWEPLHRLSPLPLESFSHRIRPLCFMTPRAALLTLPPEIPVATISVSGFVAMLAALATTVVDFVGTQVYERKHREEQLVSRYLTRAATAAHQYRMLSWWCEADVEESGERKEPMASSASTPTWRPIDTATRTEWERVKAGTRTRTTATRTEWKRVKAVRLLFTNLRKEQYKAVEFRGADTGAGNRVTLVIIGLSLGVSQSPLTIRR